MASLAGAIHDLSIGAFPQVENVFVIGGGQIYAEAVESVFCRRILCVFRPNFRPNLAPPPPHLRRLTSAA
jgi:hypothetical protein